MTKNQTSTEKEENKPSKNTSVSVKKGANRVKEGFKKARLFFARTRSSLDEKRKLRASKMNDSKRFLRAFPSDTYIADMHKASKASKPWTKWMTLIVVISAFADFYLLQDAFSYALDSPSLKEIGLKFDALPVTFMCVALVILYLFFCYLSGKKLSEYRAFKNKSTLVAALLLALIVVVVLFFISAIRYNSELSNYNLSNSSTSSGFSSGFGGFSAMAGSGFGSSSDAETSSSGIDQTALLNTLVLISVMLLGACLEFVKSYSSYDAFSAEKKRLAEGYIAEDRQLYTSVFAEYAIDPAKSTEYERRERELDGKAVDAAFRVNELSAQLNGIVDPADAYDFSQISRLVSEHVNASR